MNPAVINASASDAVERAADALKGGVIIYPTDTLYGLGADAFSDEMVARLYEIKGREEGKPIHAIVSDMEMAERYAYIDGSAQILAEKFLPGALTLILKKKTGIETGIAKGIDTFGIRIPNNQFCMRLIETFGGPITTTSANISGMMPARTIEEILEQLAEKTELLSLAIDAGELAARIPSTIVDCSGERPVIVREGVITATEIWDALGELED